MPCRRLVARRTLGRRIQGDRVLSVWPSAGRLHGRAETQAGRDDLGRGDARAEKVRAGAKMAGTLSRAARTEIGAGQPFCLCATVRSDGAVRSHDVLGHAGSLARFLETGSQVVMTVEATMEADQLKLLGRSVAPIDAVVADAGGAGLRVFIDGPEVIGQLQRSLLMQQRTVCAGAGRSISA